MLASATGNFQRPALLGQQRLQLRQNGWAIALGGRAVFEHGESVHERKPDSTVG
jgi:hypothetical protein